MYKEPYFEPEGKDNLVNKIPGKIGKTYLTEEALRDAVEEIKDKKAENEKLYNELYGFSIHPNPSFFANEPDDLI